jgi:hypothetical protein
MLFDMKKSILLLAFLVVAIMAFSQTRRTTNDQNTENQPITRPVERPAPTSPQRETRSNDEHQRSNPSPTTTPSRTASENNDQQPVRRTQPQNQSSESSSPNRERENSSQIRSTEESPQRSISSPSNAPSRTANENNDQQPVRRTQTQNNSSDSPSQTGEGGNPRQIRSTDESQQRSTSSPATTPSRRDSENIDRQSIRRTSTQRSTSSPTTTPSRRASENNDQQSIGTPSRNNSSGSSSRGRNSGEMSDHRSGQAVKSPIVVRETRVVHHHHYVHQPIEYRRIHYQYRAPRIVYISYTNYIYNDFMVFYPDHYYYINLSFTRNRRISALSAYDAMFHIGEVRKVYGIVSEVYYSELDDIYYLYMGAPFPYHDFSVIIEGHDYRRHRFPSIFRLEGRHIWSLGLITEFDGKPEMLIRKPYQLGIY